MKRPRDRRAGKPEGAGARDAVTGPARPVVERMAEFLRAQPWLAALLLVSATIIAYLPVWHAGLIWDDASLVIDNPLIRQADGLYRLWFTTQPVDFYPVTSTMLWLEWRLWGTDPMGYHVVNVLVHAGSAVLLWRVLKRLDVPGSWLAAALFAVHPVNVESVAWITQRKNTLAMFFYLLSLSWYIRFEPASRSSLAAQPAAAPATLGFRWRWYWLSLIAFLVAMLSKTAVAPMPLVLLGLAWWRRGRVQRRDLGHCVPFLVAAVAVGLVSLWFQSHRAIGSDIVRTDSFWARLAGAGWAIWFYLYKAALPFGLSSIYPRWQIDGGQWWSYLPGLLLVGVLGACWRYRRGWGRGPLAGLGYFIAMLLPILGFWDIGFMALSLVADHWQYFAIVGPLALVAAAISTVGRPPGRLLLAVAMGGVLLVLLGGLTWRQSKIYADPGIFWGTALAANADSWLAHNNLGNFLFEQGEVNEAMAHYKRAVDIKPGYSTAHYNLGGVLRQKGQLDEAIPEFQKALAIQPKYSMAHYNLGEIFRQKGQMDEAMAHYERAVEIRPEYAEAHNSLAVVFLRKGQVDEALAHLQKALEIRPDVAEDHNNLANVLWQKGQVQAAIAHYRRALEIRPAYAMAHQNLGQILQQEGQVREAATHFEKALEAQPDFAPACNSLAWVMATSQDATLRNGTRAIELAEVAVRAFGGSNPTFVATLAAAYAEARRFPEAVDTVQRALQLAQARNKPALAERLGQQLALYQEGSPYRDTGKVGN
jgi:tetratricopeptide (TPR) repeat protein